VELVTKFVYFLAVSSFAIGAWVTGIQFTVTAHSKTLERVQDDQRADEKKYIDVLGRIDERLKNIEKKR
jgi:hypothetical protein